MAHICLKLATFPRIKICFNQLGDKLDMYERNKKFQIQVV